MDGRTDGGQPLPPNTRAEGAGHPRGGRRGACCRLARGWRGLTAGSCRSSAGCSAPAACAKTASWGAAGGAGRGGRPAPGRGWPGGRRGPTGLPTPRHAGHGCGQLEPRPRQLPALLWLSPGGRGLAGPGEPEPTDPSPGPPRPVPPRSAATPAIPPLPPSPPGRVRAGAAPGRRDGSPRGMGGRWLRPRSGV